MRNPTYILQLPCQFCGATVGEVGLHQPMTVEEYRASVGIIDQRCSDCEAQHGAFIDSNLS